MRFKIVLTSKLGFKHHLHVLCNELRILALPNVLTRKKRIKNVGELKHFLDPI